MLPTFPNNPSNRYNQNGLSITVIFAEPFATIEKLVKLAKEGIAEFGLEKFKQNVISSYDEWVESTKKAPEGADFNSSICLKWWRLGDSNS